MKRLRFSKEQIIAIQKQQESGAMTADVCREHGISSATFYKWKAKFGGLEMSDARRLRTLEEATGRADAGQRDAEGCRVAKVVTPGAKREAVAHFCTAHQVSQRRACSVLGVDRSSVRYRSVRPDDALLRKAMKPVAVERRRFG